MHSMNFNIAPRLFESPSRAVFKLCADNNLNADV
jgi:hypothetical protein